MIILIWLLQKKNISFKLVLRHRSFTPPPPISKDFFVSQVLYQTNEYYVEVEVGTPPQLMQLNIDTGSSYSWVRCYQCKGTRDTCYQRGYVHEEDSTSHAVVPCKTCTFPGKCNQKKQCITKLGYQDESKSEVVMAFETFSMTQDDGLTSSKQKILNVPLGCAIKTEGFQYLDGSLGLGTGKLSFYSFLKDKYGVKIFSYCLLDQIVGRNDESDMLFGEQEVSYDTSYTSMIHDYFSNNEHYGVELSGIKVDGETLAVSMFPIRMIIDTGATVSDLPKPLYNALVKKIRGIANGMAWGRAIRVGDFYPCYEIDEIQMSASPTITLTFKGDAELLLPPRKIWRYMEEDHAACFAFADASEVSSLEINILGNIQQQGIRVIIDQTAEDLIGFDPSGC